MLTDEELDAIERIAADYLPDRIPSRWVLELIAELTLHRARGRQTSTGTSVDESRLDAWPGFSQGSESMSPEERAKRFGGVSFAEASRNLQANLAAWNRRLRRDWEWRAGPGAWGYYERFECDRPDVGVGYRVLEDDWDLDYRYRVIKKLEVV